LERPRWKGFRELCRGRRFVFGQTIAIVKGREQRFDTLLHPGAVAIVAMDDNERVLLEKQYRPIIDKWLYEVPAGTLEEGEDPAEAARRELLEETGYEPRKLCHVASFYPSPGVSTELIHVYIAGDLVYKGQRLEEDELIETIWIPVEEAVDMVWRGEIVDGKTIIALLVAKSLGYKCS
jgi:ADP-ribose pyrophosphatase